MSNVTKFNPEGKKVLTYGECLRPAMAITEQADADQYLSDYVDYIQKALDAEPREDGMTARQIALINIGYFAGYYDHETMARTQKLFGAAHPIFGKEQP